MRTCTNSVHSAASCSSTSRATARSCAACTSGSEALERSILVGFTHWRGRGRRGARAGSRSRVLLRPRGDSSSRTRAGAVRQGLEALCSRRRAGGADRACHRWRSPRPSVPPLLAGEADRLRATSSALMNGARPKPGSAGQRSLDDVPRSLFGQSWSPEKPAYPAAPSRTGPWLQEPSPPASQPVRSLPRAPSSPTTPRAGSLLRARRAAGNDVSSVPLPWASFRRVPTESQSRPGQEQIKRGVNSATDPAASARGGRTARLGGGARRSRARPGRR